MRKSDRLDHTLIHPWANDVVVSDLRFQLLCELEVKARALSETCRMKWWRHRKLEALRWTLAELDELKGGA